jgi:hypothetical protein
MVLLEAVLHNSPGEIVMRPARLCTPEAGDVILRWLGAGMFEILDAQTERHLSGPVSLGRALELAKSSGAAVIWQQNVDERGRPLGSPYRIPLGVPTGR